jgi:hypothetical protein
VVGDNTPTVEGAQIIKDTVRAAAIVDWPSECFRIIVLDDGADPELKDCHSCVGTSNTAALHCS